MSDKAAAFKRIRDARLPKAVKAIDLLGNLSNRGNYQYSDKQARELVREIDLARDNLAKAFQIDQRAQKLTAAGPISAPDQTSESLEPINKHARSWVAWALERIQSGDPTAAQEMLKTGLKLNTRQ